MSKRAPWPLWEIGLYLAIGLYYHRALGWVVHTWSENTYESWGFIALLLLVPRLRQLPGQRPVPSARHLLGIVLLALVDHLLAPLKVNALSALLGICSLHLGCVSFRALRGRWYLQGQLWLALCSLPLAYWANAVFGFQLQHLATRAAAQGLGLYGLSASVQGTLLHLPGVTVAVDTACSGIKLLYTGVIFGILAAPGGRTLAVKTAYWGVLLLLLFGANVMRILCLTMAHLQLGHPIGAVAHELIGLAAFGLCLGVPLALLHTPARWRPARTCRLPLTESGVLR